MRGIGTIVGVMSHQDVRLSRNGHVAPPFKQSVQSDNKLQGDQVLLGDKFAQNSQLSYIQRGSNLERIEMKNQNIQTDKIFKKFNKF